MEIHVFHWTAMIYTCVGSLVGLMVNKTAISQRPLVPITTTVKNKTRFHLNNRILGKKSTCKKAGIPLLTP